MSELQPAETPLSFPQQFSTTVETVLREGETKSYPSASTLAVRDAVCPQNNLYSTTPTSVLRDDNLLQYAAWTQGFDAAIQQFPIFGQESYRYRSGVIQLAREHRQGNWLAEHIDFFQFNRDIDGYVNMLSRPLLQAGKPIAPLVQFIHTHSSESDNLKYQHSPYPSLLRTITGETLAGCITNEILDEWMATVSEKEQYTPTAFARDATAAWCYTMNGNVEKATEVAMRCLKAVESCEEVHYPDEFDPHEDQLVEWWLRLGYALSRVGKTENALQVFRHFVTQSVNRAIVFTDLTPAYPSWITDTRYPHIGLWVALGCSLGFDIAIMETYLIDPSLNIGVIDEIKTAIKDAGGSVEPSAEKKSPISPFYLREAAVRYYIPAVVDFAKKN